MKHNYTLSGELPELVQAKLNAMNISEVKPYIGTFSQSKSSSLRQVLYNVFAVKLSLSIRHISDAIQGILEEDT